MFGNSINSVFDTGIPSSVLSIAMVVILLMQIFLVTGMSRYTNYEELGAGASPHILYGTAIPLSL